MKDVIFFFVFSFLFIVPILSQGYTEVSDVSGVGYTHEGFDFTYDMPVGVGAAWFDYDNDEWVDLYIVNRIGANKLYRNNGNGTFTDIAGALGVEDALHDGGGVVVGDINNDGYQDIYLANSDENVLLLNNQGTSFTDITSSAGLGTIGPNRSTSGSFGDYDNDGYLDLYVTHHIGIMSTGVGITRDYLYHNNGDRTFTDVSSLLDISLLNDPGFASSWTDIDKDGDQDLIVVNDCPFYINGNPNNGTLVFENQGGTNPLTAWNFEEKSASLIEDDCSNGMGLGIGDYNRDGYMDVVYSNVGPARLFKNNNGVFQSQNTAGVSIQPFDHFSWGTSFMDYNNDGWQDIVMAIGSLTKGANVDTTQACNFFHNNGDGTFLENASTLGIDDEDRTRTIIHGDYDNDGDLDLLMLNYDGEIRLFRNDEVNSNNWLRVKLRSKKSAPDGIGSWIEIKTNDGVKQYFEIRSGSNLGGGDEIMAHFGLGAATSIDSITVSWMSGEESIMTNVGPNTTLIIKEPTPYIYIRKGATGDNDGSDWANAYAEVSAALDVAVAGDTLLVADATYYPTDDLIENKYFSMKNGVHLIGGFPSTGGTFVERDLVGLNTILSGNINEENGGGMRAHHVIDVASDVLSCSVNGFSIVEGLADGVLPSQQRGGAIYSEGVINIENVKIEDCNAITSGSNVCSSTSFGNVTLKNVTITVMDLIIPTMSADNQSKINVLESCVIQE